MGVILKNENIIEEMIDILDDIHRYVPIQPLEVVDEMTHRPVAADMVHQLLLGGDQLTRKRIETAKECRKNGTTPTTQLTGIVPVCEDWHCKKIFLEVCIHVPCITYIQWDKAYLLSYIWISKCPLQ